MKYGQPPKTLFTGRCAPDGSSVEDNFKAWFRTSKVVDANGDPLVVHHGSYDMRFVAVDGVFRSKRERTTISCPSTRSGADPERAFFFAASVATAMSYVDEHRAFDYQNAEGGLISVYLSLQRPMVVQAAGSNWRGTRDGVALAREGGHDGLVVRNVRDNYNNTRSTLPTDVFVAFDPCQIKLALGNSGAFDAASPDLSDSHAWESASEGLHDRVLESLPESARERMRA